MRPIYAVDISNWQGVPTADEIACWQAGGVGLVWVRASLESQNLVNMTIAQLQALSGQIPTALYEWCYGDWDAAATANATEDHFASYASTPWRHADVEDVASFQALPANHPAKRAYTVVGPRGHAIVTLPHRFDAVDQSRPSLQALGQQGAVSWLQTWASAVQNRQANPGMYTAPWAWTPITGNSTAFYQLSLWVAQYDGDPDLYAFNPFAAWDHCDAKQYDGGSTNFCGQDVDRDVADADVFLPLPPPVVTPPPVEQPPAQDICTQYETSIVSTYNRLVALQPIVDQTLTASIENLTYPGLTGPTAAGAVHARPPVPVLQAARETPTPPVADPPSFVPSATTITLPPPGTPGFWTLLWEVLAVNFLDVINWSTALPFIVAVIANLLGHFPPMPTIDLAAIMGGLNATLQTLKATFGTGNFAEAVARAQAKMAERAAAQAAEAAAGTPPPPA
jgi:hypothetical protein